jgi:O-antigen ligase
MNEHSTMAGTTEAVRSSPAVRVGTTAHFQRLSDGLAVAVAISLPLSISASGVLIALWVVACLATLDLQALRRIATVAAAMVPVALSLLALVGTFWATTDFSERVSDLKVFLRLPIIALLLIQFQRSNRGAWVLGGFLSSCSVLLVASWLQWLWPVLDVRHSRPGVPVKDYIIQSGEFLLCAFALVHLSFGAWRQSRPWSALLWSVLGLGFLTNILFVAAARTIFVVLIAFVVLFGLQRFGWKGAIAGAVLALVLSLTVWLSSPLVRTSVMSAVEQFQSYHTSPSETSVGYRLAFWNKSLEIIARAPIIGHGTGSLDREFRRLAEGKKGLAAAVTNNPHNQTLIVAIQLGLAGVALLYALWLAHLLLFRGNDLLSWVGSAVVLHNIGSGLFNSQLFEATLGWVYIFGVGVIGGMVLRARAAAMRVASHES